MNEYVIVVAGGRGLRMGGDLPKQFMPIGGRPILMHTLEAFERAIPGIQLILVLPADQQAFWHDLCSRHAFTLRHTVVDGGATRFHSVLNGLRSIENDEPSDVYDGCSLVGVHDGVRPFVSVDVIRRCYETAREGRAVVPVVPVVETVRQLSPAASQASSPLASQPAESDSASSSFTLDRSLLRLVQTPQVFPLDLLRRAYEQPYRDTFTDDASVVEALGYQITLVEGNRENIKITTPFDMAVAETVVGQSEQQT